GDGRLAQPERPSGRPHRTLAGESEEYPNVIPIHRLARRLRRTSHPRGQPFTLRDCRSIERCHAMSPLVVLNSATKTFHGSAKTEITASKFMALCFAPGRCLNRHVTEREMKGRAPTIIDLTAELAKLTMFRGLTPWTTREERRGSATLLGPYR